MVLSIDIVVVLSSVEIVVPSIGVVMVPSVGIVVPSVDIVVDIIVVSAGGISVVVSAGVVMSCVVTGECVVGHDSLEKPVHDNTIAIETIVM